MKLVSQTTDIHAEMTAWRRDIHRHHETGFEEHRTSRIVADKMTGGNRLRAHWRGGVPKEYFVSSKVRFYVDGKWVNFPLPPVTARPANTVRRIESLEHEVLCHTVGLDAFAVCLH